MDKSLGQLLIGAVLDAVAVQVLREKKPELFDEIKSDTKDFVKDLKGVYSKVRAAVKDWSENPS